MTGSVGIVGGGIGGLTAALGFCKAGWKVTVYERAPEFTEVGAAVVLYPNALAALDEVGAGAAVRASSIPDRSGAIRNHRGRRLLTTTTTELLGDEEVVVVHRASLIAALVEQVPEQCLRSGVRVSGVSGDGTVQTDAGTFRHDLVVGADGVHSVVRKALWPDDGVVHRTGVTAWRWIVDEPPQDFVGMFVGVGAEFGLLPLARNRTYVYAGARPGIDDLRHFADWPDPVPRMVATADPARTIVDELLEIRTPKSLARGKVALIGDAAHAMRPHLGVGAAMAIEDAVTLAACAPDLDVYSRARRRRDDTFQRLSRLAAPIIMPRTRFRASARDLAIRMTPDRVAARGFGAIAAWRPRPITVVGD